MNYRHFVVSPSYNGIGWYDPKACVNFFKTDGVISVPEDANYLNIDRYVKLNYLVEVTKQEEEELPQLTVHTHKQLLSEEDIKVDEPVKNESIEDLGDKTEEVKEARDAEDKRYTFESLDEKKYSEVREIAKELDLKASGKKDEIIQRILDNQNN